MSKVLVTGGSGFLGAHVCDVAYENGDEVTIYDQRPPKFDLKQERFNFIKGSTNDEAALEQQVLTHDRIIHLAGILGTAETVENPQESIDVNITASVKLFNVLKLHPEKTAMLTVNGNYQWYNTYAITKEAAGRFAIMYNQAFSTKIAVVRALNAYGPWQKLKPVRKIVPEFIYRALNDQPLEIFGDGTQTFDLVHARDVALSFYRSVSVDHGVYDTIFESGTGKVTTPTDLAQKIITMTGSKSQLKFLPMRKGEPTTSEVRANTSTLLPFGDIPITAEETGLASTIEWYKSNGFDF